jgi:2-C-methyl-D-erythritol 4-phosphate cytidylyltransferase/2-C-methyl-D-erythritol 2,4-cyclodiphosphate synthase
VVAAAGRGERLRSPDNKAFVPLGGKPLVSYALEAFRACDEIGELVLVVAAEDVERARRELLSGGAAKSERAVAGGAQRQESVAAALAEVSLGSDLVIIHDGARPFVKPELIRRCLEGAAAGGAAIAALPSTDTVKEVSPEGAVVATLDRGRLWLVQTPQAFRRDLIVRAHQEAAEAGVLGTDDASLVERIGHAVQVVMGDTDNVKITWPEDVRRAEHALARNREVMPGRPAIRSGIGYDAHRFAQDRPLVLAGVKVRAEGGLLGHSDADVVCHAVCDALLGAIGAGDIGQHFPDTDPRYAGISSLSLLERVSRLVRDSGWEIENVDAVVVAEEPRIAPYIAEMRRALGEAMEIEAGRVSVKGKTTEGMGFTGRGEGIASQAIAVLRPADNSRRGANPEE